jgi:hypothetical protein
VNHNFLCLTCLLFFSVKSRHPGGNVIRVHNIESCNNDNNDEDDIDVDNNIVPSLNNNDNINYTDPDFVPTPRLMAQTVTDSEPEQSLIFNDRSNLEVSML